MIREIAAFVLLFTSFHSVSIAAARPHDPSPLQLKETIPLPGVHGRIDHMDVDPDGRRIFIAALGNNTVVVVSLDSAGTIQMLPGFDEPQGIVFLPGSQLLLVANGGNGSVSMLDATSFKSVASFGNLRDADNIRYDPNAKRVVVGYGSGGLAVIDPLTRALDYTIPLPAHPESFQIEYAARRVFVNVPDNGDIEVVDQGARRMASKWRTRPAHDNFPMALDSANHRLFVGFRDPASVEVLDTRTGAVLSTTTIHGDVDDIFLDEQRKRLYASCGQGYIDVLSRIGINQLTRAAFVATRRGARTSLFIPSLNLLVVALPESRERPAMLQVYTVR